MLYLQGQKNPKNSNRIYISFCGIWGYCFKTQDINFKDIFSKLGLISHPGKNLPSPIFVAAQGNEKEICFFVLFNQNIFLNV